MCFTLDPLIISFTSSLPLHSSSPPFHVLSLWCNLLRGCKPVPDRYVHLNAYRALHSISILWHFSKTRSFWDMSYDWRSDVWKIEWDTFHYGRMQFGFGKLFKSWKIVSFEDWWATPPALRVMGTEVTFCFGTKLWVETGSLRGVLFVCLLSYCLGIISNQTERAVHTASPIIQL